MDLSLFEKVTKIENGEMKGLKIDIVSSDYKEKMKTFKQEFNELVNQINVEDLKVDILDNKWQSSGYYKKYFWSKIFFEDEKYLNKDLCFWIGADIDGLHIYLGTSDTFNIVSREDIFRFVIDNIDVNKKFNNFKIDTEYDFIRYTYTGNENKINSDDFIKVLEYLKPIYKMTIKKFIKKVPISVESKNEIKIKNIILYGAPGVGKTHNYKNLISMIEEGKSQNEIFSAISKNEEISLDNETFETIKKEKRVEFVTFHQSYSYEDFIEGFRPNESGNIELEDGIFKKLSDTARKNLEEAKKDKEVISQENLFKKKIEVFIENLEEEIEKNGYYAITDAAYLTSADIDAFRYNIRRENPTYKYDLRMKFEDLYKFYENNVQTRGDIKNLESINSLARQHASYFFKVFEKIKNINVSIENNIEKIQKKNYYIVIDEINRGNISKIFGELITLIEEDKRDVYEVTLPYSKEKFSVPSNLHIIATMNSTDKSIATVDIALRRRFTFLKMQPKPELVKHQEAKELMEKLNEHIENILGEDYKLGHSYFMKIVDAQDLEFVKEYKIKPLLEEYFYADEKAYIDALEILKTEEYSDE